MVTFPAAWRRRAASIAVVLIGAAAAYLLVALLSPQPDDTQRLAQRLLTEAHRPPDGKTEARIIRLLPSGGWADVTTPDPADGAPAVVRYHADGTIERPGANDALPRPIGVVAGATGKDGYATVVAVPSTGSHRLATVAAAAAVLLTATALLALTPSKPPPGTAPSRRDAEQRAALIHDFAELLPQMPEAIAWQAGNILETAGVAVVRPDGQRFDPARHQAVGTERAPGRDTAGLVARTVRPGYADGEHLVVYPRVVVFTDEVS